MTDKELIKQEIEKRFNDNMKASEQYAENSKSRALFTSAAKEDYDLLAFIDGTCVYNHEKLTKFDWQSFRAEAAKDFTVAILSNPKWSEHFKTTDKDFRFDKAYYKKVVIGNALSYTDELIKQLKEKEMRNESNS